MLHDSPDSVNYIRRALHEERVPCPTCGLPDAVGPFVHRDARDPAIPCKGTGGVGPISKMWMDIVHPELARRAAEIVPKPAVYRTPEERGIVIPSAGNA